MKIGFLITARLKSRRLPKKLLLPLNGYSVIERVIQRAKKVVDPENIILCTSTFNQDLPLTIKATNNNIFYFNGHSDDVLKRLRDAAKFFGFDYFIGITGDNPLFSIEYAKLIKGIIHKENSLDYIYTADLPLGLNIYGLKVEALETVCSIKEIIDTEIWGPLINRPEIFNIKKIDVNPVDIRNNCRLTLDEKKDYNLIKLIFENYEKDYVMKMSDIYKIIDTDKKLLDINKDVIQRKLDIKIKQKIDQFYTDNQKQIIKIKSKIYKS